MRRHLYTFTQNPPPQNTKELFSPSSCLLQIKLSFICLHQILLSFRHAQYFKVLVYPKTQKSLSLMLLRTCMTLLSAMNTCETCLSLFSRKVSHTRQEHPFHIAVVRVICNKIKLYLDQIIYFEGLVKDL